ncbi:phasin, partial [Mesorhizobium sp. USDA-HM6]
MSKIPGKTETIENAESATFEPSKATEQVRAVAEQGVEQAKEAFSKLQSDAEITQKAFESTFEMAKTTRSEVSLTTIAALRANAEATFTHLEALVAVKSPSEFFELQSAFLNKQFEISIEQAKT